MFHTTRLTGKAPQEPRFNTPETQLIWGAAMAYLTGNPDQMKSWLKPPAEGVTLAQTDLWKQVSGTDFAYGELLSHAHHIREALRDKDTKYGWGEPGSGFQFDRNKNLINVDFMQSLIVGFEHARADVYHTREAEETDVAIYRGENGWHYRGIAALAADLKWPLIGEFLGGTQRLTPRVQLVLTPGTKNLSIPNEDARAVDLEDSNLFALNRFPGYDRWEDGSRITYGLEWDLDRPNWSIQSVIGQSYRLSRKQGIFPRIGFTATVRDLPRRPEATR